MPTVDSSGTLTADGTEQTLADLTVNKYYSAHVDLHLMDVLDVVTLRLYLKVLTGSTLGLYWTETYYDVQTNRVIIYIPPMPAVWEWKLTLQQSAGTNRNFDWVVYKV